MEGVDQWTGRDALNNQQKSWRRFFFLGGGWWTDGMYGMDVIIIIVAIFGKFLAPDSGAWKGRMTVGKDGD